MPVIDLKSVPPKTGSIYPAPHDAAMAGRSSLRLSDAGGLSQFGANLVILDPGAQSSLRHWHLKQDEFVMVTEGAVTLIDDSGETLMNPGDCAAFPAGDANGHHFVNKSDAEARFLVIGTRTDDEVATYSDLDMMVETKNRISTFTHKDGAPYGAGDQT